MPAPNKANRCRARAPAGGLAALKDFFTRVPSDSGLAYVVIVHLSPEHESRLPDLLQQATTMPVTGSGSSRAGASTTTRSQSLARSTLAGERMPPSM